MSTPRPSEADVEAPFDLRVAIADPGSILPRKEGETVARWSARAVLASDWLAARDAEHEREVADLREQVAFLETELDADAKHAALAEGESCDVCTHLESEQVQRWMAEDEDRAEAAERALAGLRGEIEALADEWETEAGEDSEARRVYGPQSVSVPFAVASLRALLPRDDAAGAGGAR